MKRAVLFLVPLLMAAAVACGSDDDGSSGSAQSPVPAAAHNDADVEFAHGMIPHHRQAVQMAGLASTRSQNDDVLQLAETIKAAQEPEIRTLEGWLEEWDEPLEATSGEHHGGDSGMGMMSDDDMTMLEGARGGAFDRAFLEMMIEHHRGAVDMAEQELQDGQFADARDMAETIKSTQETEIIEMEQLLEEI